MYCDQPYGYRARCHKKPSTHQEVGIYSPHWIVDGDTHLRRNLFIRLFGISRMEYCLWPIEIYNKVFTIQARGLWIVHKVLNN